MKVEEAIKSLNYAEADFIGTKYAEAFPVAISALEKQIPKKPCIPFDSIRQEYECPACPHWVYKAQQYCDQCGQALDWSDSE